jgi:1,4-alpha-glucan branching enzyme
MTTPPLDPKTITDIDGYLRPNVAAIIQRHNSYRRWKDTIDRHEGGYERFTKGYLKFGLNVGRNNEVIYQEWAPNAVEAVLIGDFSLFSRLFFPCRSLRYRLQMSGTDRLIR